MTLFNPDTFLNDTFTGKLSTEVELIPPGEYNAVLMEIKPNFTTSGFALLNLTWQVVDNERPANGASPLVRQTIWLDLDEGGGLNTRPGKNVALGRMRAMFGQNDASHPWQPQMMIGQRAHILVEHQPDRNDSQKIWANVTKVAAGT